MEPSKDLVRIWRRAERALWCIVALLLIQVTIYGFAEWRYQQNGALRFSFSERAPMLARDMQWDNLLREALARQKQVPTDAYGYFWAGVAHIHLKNWKQAESFFDKTEEVNPMMYARVQIWRNYMRDLQRGTGKIPSLTSFALHS